MGTPEDRIRAGGKLRASARRLSLCAATASLLITACSSNDSAETDKAPSTGSNPVEEALGAPFALATGRVHDPAAAIDPSSGRIYVVWGEEAGSNSAFQSFSAIPKLAYSDDGGATFSSPITVSSDPDEIGYTRPLIVVAPNGTVLMAWERWMPDDAFEYGQEKLRVARSTDGGKTFTVDDAVKDGVPSLSILPALNVDSSGVASIFWLDYRARMADQVAENVPVEIRAATSTDDGKTWSTPVLVSAASCTCCRVAATSREGGPWVASWRGFQPVTGPDDTIRDVVVSRSMNGGTTWDVPSKIHDDGWAINACPVVGPSLAFDASAKLHAVWYTGADRNPGVLYASSNDDGKTFSEPIRLMAMKPVSEHMHGGDTGDAEADNGVPAGTDPTVAVDVEGAAWIAWTDGASPPRVHVARVDAHGKMDVAGKLANGRAPQLAAAAGRAILAWGEEGADASTPGTIWVRAITP
jgi:hypothetical protein